MKLIGKQRGKYSNLVYLHVTKHDKHRTRVLQYEHWVTEHTIYIYNQTWVLVSTTTGLKPWKKERLKNISH